MPALLGRRGCGAMLFLTAIALLISPLSQIFSQSYQGQSFLNETPKSSGVNVTSLSTHSNSVPLTKLSPRDNGLPNGVTLTLAVAKRKGAAAIGLLNGPGLMKDANTPPEELDGWSEYTLQDENPHKELTEPLQHLFPHSLGRRRGLAAKQDKDYQDLDDFHRVSQYLEPPFFIPGVRTYRS